MVDCRSVRVIALEVGLGRLCRDEVLPVLQGRHWVRMHAGLRAVFLPECNLPVEVTIVLTGALASGSIQTALSGHRQGCIGSCLASTTT